jgi:hypothetical protein
MVHESMIAAVGSEAGSAELDLHEKKSYSSNHSAIVCEQTTAVKDVRFWKKGCSFEDDKRVRVASDRVTLCSDDTPAVQNHWTIATDGKIVQ